MVGKKSVNANNVPANIITPPSVGILRVCNLRKSPGASVRFFRIETLIKEGVQINTTKKAEINIKMSQAIRENP